MELINVTKLVAGYTTATDKTGRERLVVVAKGTFGLPKQPGAIATLLEEQVPLVTADEFEGDPGFSAPLSEIDFAPRKPRCDVLLRGSCYAPEGRPAKQVSVGVRVGQLAKSFNVVGNRVWRPKLLSGVVPSDPEPFTVLPFSYGNAYGGVEQLTPDPNSQSWYPSNPVGLGFRPRTVAEQLYGQRLPNTEEIGHPVTSPNGNYKPMAFGPLGRSWKQRVKWAGTYDTKWREEQYPFLPLDFDERYFQCAPEDQQTEYLQGGETVVLVNLTPQGRIQFTLPELNEPFVVHYKNGEIKRLQGVVDTLVLEPDLQRFTLSLRISFPLRRSVHEVRRVELGRVMPQPVPAPGTAQTPIAKPYYKGLSKLIAAQRAARRSGESE